MFGILLPLLFVLGSTSSDYENIEPALLQTSKGSTLFYKHSHFSDSYRTIFTNSHCYKDASKDLLAQCILGDQENISRVVILLLLTYCQIALSLCNCLWADMGKNQLECKASQRISDCLSGLQGSRWSLFLELKTHCDNICTYPKLKLWKKRSDELINKLVLSSEERKDLL